MFEDRKIIVLDDDPTGTQTVHDVTVYTDWEESTLYHGFENKEKMFFVLTNSRSFSQKKTIQVHQKIGQRIRSISQALNKKYLIISRGDSTLRGHYPEETEALASGLGVSFDGEVLIPFFPESGRLTKGNIHYVWIDGTFIPVGETEFARDQTFGFHASDLREWVEEKTMGRYQAKDCLSVLEGAKEEEILKTLLSANKFQKIIVNAVSYQDIECFARVLDKALQQGKHYLFRTAAAFVKVAGEVKDQELLSADVVCDFQSKQGGLIIVGSHVRKTTRQLEKLRKEMPELSYYEFDVRDLLESENGRKTAEKAADFAEKQMNQGKTVVIYTSRQSVILTDGDKEEQLRVSVRISDALTSVPQYLSKRPRYLLAKGGITSSDIATKSLGIHCATVIGQIAPGVPVWKIGKESRFPGMSYIIFPGNVGDDNTLKDIVVMLEKINGEAKKNRKQ